MVGGCSTTIHFVVSASARFVAAEPSLRDSLLPVGRFDAPVLSCEPVVSFVETVALDSSQDSAVAAFAAD